jgi:hypothetical protein
MRSAKGVQEHRKIMPIVLRTYKMTYHSDPVPFWCPLDPALWGSEAPWFGAHVLGYPSRLPLPESERNTV